MKRGKRLLLQAPNALSYIMGKMCSRSPGRRLLRAAKRRQWSWRGPPRPPQRRAHRPATGRRWRRRVALIFFGMRRSLTPSSRRTVSISSLKWSASSCEEARACFSFAFQAMQHGEEIERQHHKAAFERVGNAKLLVENRKPRPCHNRAIEFLRSFLFAPPGHSDAR